MRTVAPIVLVCVFVLAACDGGRSGGSDVGVPVTELPDVPADFDLVHAVTGQTVYVPAYSSIYHQWDNRVLELTVTLSIRNTDAESGIILTRVSYYDGAGELVREYIEHPKELGRLSTAEFVIDQTDEDGGPGASFLVEWVATERATLPIVEAVMIGTSGQQGISFTSRGEVIEVYTASEEH